MTPERKLGTLQPTIQDEALAVVATLFQ